MDRVGRDESPFFAPNPFIAVGENAAVEVGVGYVRNPVGQLWVADFGYTGKEPKGSPDACHPRG